MGYQKDKFRRFLDKLFSPAKGVASLALSLLSSIVLLGAMVGTMYLSNIFSLSGTKSFAIIFSSIVCSLLTVPLTLIWLPKIRNLIRKTDDKNQTIIDNQQNEIHNLKQLIENQKNTEGNLQDKIHLLENLVFTSQSSIDILKVGYKEYTKLSTIRIKEKLNETQGKIFSSAGYDEVILIVDCKIKYQRGIDFKNLRLAYSTSNHNSVIVTNLKPEYTNAPRFEYNTFFAELRHVELDKNGNIKRIQILKDDSSLETIKKLEQKCKEDFESTFQGDKNGESVQETNEIIKISKDCIRLLLKPYFSNIEFDTHCEIKDAKPWTDFLQNQVDLLKTMELK